MYMAMEHIAYAYSIPTGISGNEVTPTGISQYTNTRLQVDRARGGGGGGGEKRKKGGEGERGEEGWVGGRSEGERGEGVEEKEREREWEREEGRGWRGEGDTSQIQVESVLHKPPLLFGDHLLYYVSHLDGPSPSTWTQRRTDQGPLSLTSAESQTHSLVSYRRSLALSSLYDSFIYCRSYLSARISSTSVYFQNAVVDTRKNHLLQNWAMPKYRK